MAQRERKRIVSLAFMSSYPRSTTKVSGAEERAAEVKGFSIRKQRGFHYDINLEGDDGRSIENVRETAELSENASLARCVLIDIIWRSGVSGFWNSFLCFREQLINAGC
jgi:hypothetical protein